MFRRSRKRPDMGCERARLGISARADGERIGPTGALEAHLRACAPCRRFDLACQGARPELVGLGRRLGLHPARRAPADLIELLVASRTSSGARRRRTAPYWRRRLSWATAIVPSALAAAAFPLAFAHPPTLVPSHTPSACTHELSQVHDPSSR